MSNIQFVIPSEVIGSYWSPQDKVVITGEFDDWQHSKYVLQYFENEGFRAEIPRIKGREKAMFKLVINDREWITLAYFETAVDGSGHTNNVLNYQDYEVDDSLDNVTISSARQDSEQQRQLLSYAAEVSGEQYMSPVMLSPASAPQVALNDYVNISSHGELSSTEDLDFEPSDADLEETLQYDTNAGLLSNQRPLNGLVSIVKKAKTYWNS